LTGSDYRPHAPAPSARLKLDPAQLLSYGEALESDDPFLHARFNHECVHYVECMREYVDRVDALLEQMAGDHGEDYYGMYTHMIPDHHWKAAIIHIYSVFEQKICEACVIAETTLGLPPFQPKRKGSPVGNAERYLEVHTPFPAKITAGQWSDVHQIRRIRNVLVHGGFDLEHANFALLSSYADQTKKFKVYPAKLVISAATVSLVLEKLGEPLCVLGEGVIGMKEKRVGDRPF
jgi:hypothetical protein